MRERSCLNAKAMLSIRAVTCKNFDPVFFFFQLPTSLLSIVTKVTKNSLSMRNLLLLLISCSALFRAQAQSTGTPASMAYYFGQAAFSENITAPKTFFGHEVGDWHITPESAAAYYRLLDAESDRIKAVPYGRTWEQRALTALIITHPDNVANLESIRKRHLQFSDPKASEPDASKEPVIVWQGFSVHGNEPSGGNAAVLYAYYLAASQSPEVLEWLKNAVIIFDPVINPDGFARFAHWANSRRATTLPNADPSDWEHNEPWPRGRTNHYWFDLNRDWLPLVNPESRGRVALFKQWMPNVLTDHHEMGTNSTFFFQPGVPARTNPLTPKQTVELTAKIGTFHAAALDSIGSAYFTKESYDDYYYGKGSTYPDLQGGVGILFEQASSRGHRQESVNGVLSFAFTIRNQLTTAQSTLKAAVALRKSLLEHQRWFFKSAVEEATKEPVQAFIFGDANDPQKNASVVQLLLQHNIEVYEPAREGTFDGISFPKATSFVVPVAQPQARLVKALFNRTLAFEDTLFYDISTWTLPFAAGLPYASLNKAAASGITGKQVAAKPEPAVVFSAPDKAAVYLVAPGQDSYFRFLHRALASGLNMKVIVSPSTVLTPSGKKTFPPGSLLLSTPGPAAGSVLADLGKETGVDVYGAATGLADGGIDAGSPSALAVSSPSIALLVGEGVTVSEAGELWHLLDAVQGFPVTLLSTDLVSARTLKRYNRLIMPGGTYATLSKNTASAIRDWVRDGNVLLATTNAISWLNANEVVKAEFPEAGFQPATYVPYNRQEAFSGSQEVAGAIFDATVDVSHPIGWGYSSGKVALFRDHNRVLKPSGLKAANPVMYSSGSQLSGWVSSAILKQMQGGAGVAVHRLGSGRIILYADNPNFRSFFTGTNRLFLNGLFFGNLIRNGAAEASE
jgi:hypothetical protein